MGVTDFTKLPRRQLIKHFEQERQDWLSLGMSEADIFFIHFGEPCENGKGGDYRMWLDERKPIRTDRKYAVGDVASLEELECDGKQCAVNVDEIGSVELSVDLKRALSELTNLQRYCFVEVMLNGRTQASVALDIGKSRATVQYAIDAARKNLKKYFLHP